MIAVLTGTGRMGIRKAASHCGWKQESPSVTCTTNPHPLFPASRKLRRFFIVRAPLTRTSSVSARRSGWGIGRGKRQAPEPGTTPAKPCPTRQRERQRRCYGKHLAASSPNSVLVVGAWVRETSKAVLQERLNGGGDR